VEAQGRVGEGRGVKREPGNRREERTRGRREKKQNMTKQNNKKFKKRKREKEKERERESGHITLQIYIRPDRQAGGQGSGRRRSGRRGWGRGRRRG
jgi:hypothetical protein